MIKRIDLVLIEEKKQTSGVGKWLDWLKRPRRTSNAILKEVIQEPLFGEHKDFRELHEKGESVMSDLTALGCHDMDAFEMEVEPFDENVAPAPGEPIECICRVSLKESKRLNLGAKLSAEGESAVGETELKMTNYFGVMERLSGSVAGTQGQTTYNFSVEKPIIKRPFGSRMIRFGCGNSHTNNSALSSHSMDEISLWTSYVQDDHMLTYEGIYRDVKLTRGATEHMLAEGGQSIKSAIKWTFSKDSRDDRLMPSLGRRFRFSTELAGLLGSARHAKFEVDYNRNWTLNGNMTFQFVTRAGALFALGGPSHIADRFFFGGLNNPFYGFKLHGAGPRLAHDSYGGDAFWTTSAHAHLPLTPTPLGHLYAHAFAQAGNCVTHRDLTSLFALNHASAPIRASVGAGLAFTTAVGLRFDALYAVPLSHAKQDLPQSFSFGASFSFG